MERRFGCAVLALSLAACSGTSNGSIPRTTAPDSTLKQSSASAQNAVVDARHRKRVKIRIRIHFPKHNRRIGRKLKRHFDQSASTQGIETSVYESGTLLQKSAADISLGSGNCTGGAASRTCTYQVASPPGSNLTFIFRTYDQPPNSNGNIPAGASQIGAGVVGGVTITEGTVNPPIDIALGGVLASIGLAVSPSSMHTLIQSNATLQVYARDADGNAIIGTYVDGDGNTVTVNFSINPNYSGQLNFTPSSITGPQTTGVLLQGNPGASGSGGAYTISAAPSGGNASTATTTLNIVDPTLFSVNDSHLTDTSSFFGGMTYVAADDSLYYTYRAGNGGISKYTIDSNTLNSFDAPASVTGGLANDAANMQLVITGPNNIYAMTYAGAYTAQPCGLACAGAGSGITVTSGLASYGNGTNVIQTSYIGATPSPVGGTVSLGVAVDSTPNQEVWMANAAAGGNVLAFNPSNNAVQSVVMPNGEGSFDVMKDAQGMIWVTTSPLGGNSGHLVEINPANPPATAIVFTQQTNYGAPRYIVQDPVQQNVYWYDFSYFGNTGIGRLDMLAGTNNQYQFFCCSFEPGEPGAIAAADGYIYVVVDGTSQMVQVSP